jgi:4-hydroxybenzoate polyprenyltransferase
VLYIVQNILYSYKLKDIAIVDITIISIGFLIRIFLGGVVTGIVISKWLVLMVFLMSLVLALGKRRDDLLLMESGGGSGSLRNSLSGYNVEFINNSIILLSVITLMSYLLYTVSPDVISRVHSDLLYLTVIPVLVGFLRYLQLVLVFKNSGSPTQILLKDLFIQITVVAWIAIYCIIVYIFK